MLNMPADRSKLLLVAAEKGREKLSKALLETKAPLDVVDAEGYNLLQVAVTKGHVSIARLLTAHGTDALVKDAKGNTLLHLPIAANETEVVKFLVVEKGLSEGQEPRAIFGCQSRPDALLLRRTARP